VAKIAHDVARTEQILQQGGIVATLLEALLARRTPLVSTIASRERIAQAGYAGDGQGVGRGRAQS
jgi:hypothetical protein